MKTVFLPTKKTNTFVFKLFRLNKVTLRCFYYSYDSYNYEATELNSLETWDHIGVFIVFLPVVFDRYNFDIYCIRCLWCFFCLLLFRCMNVWINIYWFYMNCYTSFEVWQAERVWQRTIPGDKDSIKIWSGFKHSPFNQLTVQKRAWNTLCRTEAEVKNTKIK